MHRLSLFAVCILFAALLSTGCGGKKYDESLWGENVNYGEVLDGFMKRAEQGMMQVRDMDSARAAAETIRLVNLDLEDVVYNAPRLSEDGQIALGAIAAQHLIEVQRLKSQIDQSPPLAEVFDEGLSEMIAQLTLIASGNFVDSPVG